MLNRKLIELLDKRREELVAELNAIDTILNSRNTSNAILAEIIGTNNYFNECKFESLKFDEHCNTNFKTNIFSHKFYGGGNAGSFLEAKSKDINWKEYLLKVIKFLGGEAKTSEIAKAIIYHNNNITFIQARQTASDLLPELVQEGKINVEKSDSKKEGHKYIIQKKELSASVLSFS